MQSYVLTRTYDDIDELCAVARSWDVEFVPTASGRFRSSLLQARSGAVQVSRGRFRGSLIQRGAPPTDHWTFVVPASDSVTFRWRGHHVRGDSILVFPLNGELHSVSGPDFDVFTVAIEATHLAAVAASLRLPSPRRLVGSAEVFAGASVSLPVLRRALATVSRAAAVGTSPDDPLLAALLQSELPTQLLTAIAAAPSCAGGVPPSRLSLIRSVETHFACRTDDKVPAVADLAVLAGTSARTLRRAFHELYGCGPKEYLLAHRYNAARRLLRDADPTNAGVSTLVGRLGFWHAGSFAAEYRRRFGELPTQTLMRSDDPTGDPRL